MDCRVAGSGLVAESAAVADAALAAGVKVAAGVASADTTGEIGIEAGGAPGLTIPQKPSIGSINWSWTKRLTGPAGLDFTTWQTTSLFVFSLKRVTRWPGTSAL